MSARVCAAEDSRCSDASINCGDVGDVSRCPRPIRGRAESRRDQQLNQIEKQIRVGSLESRELVKQILACQRALIKLMGEQLGTLILGDDVSRAIGVALACGPCWLKPLPGERMPELPDVPESPGARVIQLFPTPPYAERGRF